ncbi:hypothetical protein GT640_05670 [Collinsella aerofaciens]|nr:hypothetical protein [Collinsella aerofaciens]MZI13951.1 hypothetical protein [Collinsella aerofaciens]MZJ45757.1 hypothetical protein [Collinsella aerofaciens]MZJ48956.1 hypothetical protein [Collinsella aerofaciens]MZJ49427.1 hypothetical protein [Collinsella aerofaciens]
MVLNMSTWQGAMQMKDENKTNAPAAEAAPVAPVAPKASPKPAPKPRDPYIRAENEDDDGYDPYSDRRPEREPLFEADPWR